MPCGPPVERPTAWLPPSANVPIPTLPARVKSMTYGFRTICTVSLCSVALWTSAVMADEPAEGKSQDTSNQNTAQDAGKVSATSGDSKSSSSTSSNGSSTSSKSSHSKYTDGATKIDGLITLYKKDEKVYAELKSANYTPEYIVLLSIARGIGSGSLLGGMSWGFGDDWVWQFRKIGDKVHIVRKNVRFRAAKDSPEASAVKNAYTDSVLFSLPILTKGPGGGDMIDLTSVFMSDLPQISRVLPGFAFSSSKSTWADVKGFEKNTEIEVAATYASSGNSSIESVADTRGVTINVHYSISKIPTTGYTPRLADDRIGYFLTVVKDYSKNSEQDNFVRYINRWNLQKADSKAELSPPKEPIVFWMENTIPFKYRKPIREGIEEWNKAFEKAGFVNAIEVRQQPKDADWDPEDINYNTFRWITSSAGFAMGPSRVNPYTGQILDADIIFDADFLTYWKQEFETFTPEAVAKMTGGPLDLDSYKAELQSKGPFALRHLTACQRDREMSRQFALGASFAMARAATADELSKMKEELIMQGLKDVAMHEVGHTLGLRHNFKASTWKSLKEINNDGNPRLDGNVASVMDYNPANLATKGQKQGDFFTRTVGPYDMWAIEYGYKPISGDTEAEKTELQKIAARSGEDGHAYATDEDTRGIDPDPFTNRFDLGDDPIAFAKQRAELVKELLPGVVDRMTEEGDDYTQARRAFNILLASHGRSMFFASRYVGGLSLSRAHKGDKDAPPPVEIVDPAKQREALKLLSEQVFNEKPFLVPPEVYNHMAASKWNHWGAGSSLRPDFPVHEVILMWQDRVLSQLLSSLTLERIHDTELKVPADKDCFTTAELIETLCSSVFAELETVKGGEFTNRKPAISSVRRNLQRTFLQRMSHLAMGNTSSPEDCQTMAYMQLGELNDSIKKLLDSKVKLDSYSRAHLAESSARIEKVLDARLTLSRP